MALFKKKAPVDADVLELQKTIAMLQIISLSLQETADTMEKQVSEIINKGAGKK